MPEKPSGTPKVASPLPKARLLLLAAAVGALLTSAAALTAAARASWVEVTRTAGQEIGPLVEVAAGLGLACVLGWLALAVAACIVQALRGRNRPRLAPATVHRLVCLVLGVGLGLVPAAAHATGTDGPVGGPSPVSTSATATGGYSGATDPGWGAHSPEPASTSATQPGSGVPEPEFSTGQPDPDAAGTATASPGSGDGWVPAVPDLPPKQPEPDPIIGAVDPQTSSVDRVVVVRGDSLWEIAARHLGPLATDAEIAMEWPRWYQANADLIGADPDLILPGQQLVPPG